ncbi:MAG TPA: lysophospholipid acyltransferase family protein [Rhizomicrobium sp.]|nr:lysophospholipid acyltransferase family protein [Rhizomicrobium sp.]
MSETLLPPLPAMTLTEKLRYGGEAAAFFAFMGLFRILGIDRASALGGFIGRNIFYRTHVTKRARDNLRAAFPGMSDAEIEAILVEMWDNLGRTIAEYAHHDKMTAKGPNARIEIVNLDILERASAKGKGIEFVSGHFANWETMLHAARQYGYDGGFVYRPVNNPYIDRYTVRERMTYGPREPISKGAQGTRRIFTLLRGGKSIFILVDQKTNEGLPVPFFGRDAMTTPAPSALSLKLGAVLLLVTNERMGGARFRMTIHEPIEIEPSGDHDRDVLALTTKLNAALEAVIRKRPSQWLWIHRRWPKAGDKPYTRRARDAQDFTGAGVRVDREGSSLT